MQEMKTQLKLKSFKKKCRIKTLILLMTLIIFPIIFNSSLLSPLSKIQDNREKELNNSISSPNRPVNFHYFNFFKNITINSNKVSGTGSHSNFPMLISILDTDLRYDVQPDGDDIAFASAEEWLDFEIELFNQTYSSTHAQLIAWVRIPSLSQIQDTNITMYYGNSTMSSRQNPEGVWDNNYKGVWHLNELKGGTDAIKDSTKYLNDGTDYDNPTFGETGKIYNSIEFSYDSGERIDVSDDISLHITNQLTVEAWIKPSTFTGQWRTILSKMDGSWGDGQQANFDLYTALSPTNYYFIGLSNPSGAGIGWETTFQATAGMWQHFTFVYQSSSSIGAILINGVFMGEYNFGLGTLATNTNPLYIGFNLGWLNEVFDGFIDEVRISSITRSPSWITTSYNNQNDPNSFYTIGAEHLVSTSPLNADYFNYYKVITIDHNEVSGIGSHVNFPVLISIRDEDLRYNIQEDGDDIAFSANGKWLDHQIEVINQTYSDIQAQLITWVRVPFLSTTVDTNITMYYGNSTMNSRQNPSAVWDNSYKAVWHLNDDLTDPQILDSTSNDNDGTTFGGISNLNQLPSKIGGGLSLDGVNDYVLIPHSSSLDITGYQITMEAWINLNIVPAPWDAPVMVKAASDNNEIYMLGVDGGSNPSHVNHRITTSISGYQHYDTGNLFQDTWTHICAVYDGTLSSSDRFFIYINGVEISSNYAAGTIVSSTGALRFGKRTSTDRWLNATLDELRISSVTRSVDWIATEYSNQNNPSSFYTIGTEQYAKENVYLEVQVNAIDLHGNLLPNINISLLQNGQLINYSLTDANGTVNFLRVLNGAYNFTATISSNVFNEDITKLVNFTYESYQIDKGFQTINLICNITTNFFEITDVDGIPLESGWILVGNESKIFQNCTINSGKSTFHWIRNSTKNEYNYTIEYYDENYNPKVIKLASDDILAENTTIKVQVNLTIVEFSVFTIDTPFTPVSGAKIVLRVNNTYGKSIVNLTTDSNGKATLRWINSSGINGNYSLQIEFFGDYLKFNETYGGAAKVDNINFTVKNKDSKEFRVSINLNDFQTQLISLNPSDYISVDWGSQVKLRILFNVTKDGGLGYLGPKFADLMSYQLLLRGFQVHSGTFLKEEGNPGRHYALIETKLLESDENYIIFVSAYKSGFTIPTDLILQLNILKNDIELNQSENDDTSLSVYWFEDVNISVKSYGKSYEIFTVKDSILLDSGNNFEFLISNISNDWNLSRIVFNVYNVAFGVNKEDINLNITDDFGVKYIFNSSHNHYYYDSVATNGSWSNLEVILNKESKSNDNHFNFKIEGTFTNQIDINVDLYFIRDKINVQYSKFNISDSLSLLTESEGWAIKNIIFEIYNCKNVSNWQEINLTTKTKLNITIFDGFKYSLDLGYENGTGILIIDDRVIHPISDQFLFIVESGANVIFDAKISVEYIQEFYQNQYLKTLNSSKIEQNFDNGGTFQVIATDNSWLDNDATLWINEIRDQWNNDYLPSELEMEITIGNVTYSVSDYNYGTGIFSLQGFSKEQIYSAIITTNMEVNFTLISTVEYSRIVSYETRGTVSYVVKEAPSIYGMVQYYEEFGYYLQTISTLLIDADEYMIEFTITKDHYVTEIKELELIVLKRLTSLNGSLDFFRKFEQIYAMEPVNFTFSYVDNLTNLPITNLKQQSYLWEFYDNQGQVLKSGQGDLITKDSSYILDLNTEKLTIGEYLIIVTLDKENYDYKNGMISLTILERPTLLNGTSHLNPISKSMYVGEAINFTFSFVDSITTTNIINLRNHSYTWKKIDSEGFTIESGYANLTLNAFNLYVLDFETKTRSFGSYELIATFNKENYTSKSATILLNIDKRLFSYTLSENFRNNQINVVKGQKVIIEISLIDLTQNSLNLSDATVQLIINNNVNSFQQTGDGFYRYELSTKDIDAFFTSKIITGIIIISKDDYISEEFSITIIVEMEEIFPGIPSFYFLLILSLIIAFGGSLGAYKIYKYVKLPNFIKKVTSIRKAIEEDKPISESLIYRDKEIFIGEIIKNKWEKIGLSLSEILGIEFEKEKREYNTKRKISDVARQHDQKPRGLLFMKWDEKIGTEIMAKYPEDVQVSDKTLMQIYSTHEYTGEKGIITLMVENLNILSYYTGHEQGYYLLLFLNLDDDADLYESGMPDILRSIIENIKDDSYLKLIPLYFQRLSVYPLLSEEEIPIFHYQNEIKRIIINILREDGVITKSELMVWLKDKHLEGFFDLDAILNDLIKMDIIKVSSIKGLPSELIFLVKDIFMLRTPPTTVLEDPVSHGLPSQFIQEYPNNVKKFFQEYHPTEEDNIKIVEILTNPQVYETIRLLRTAIVTREDLEKLKKKGVDDIYGVLKILWDNKMITVLHDEKNKEYYALLCDFYIDFIFPKYLLKSVKSAFDQKSKVNKVLIEFLNTLENAYFDSKSSKK
ncbi:MAG: DUF2341 domain-containing protein [Candidatus Lokiarchaeota archaeon]|nr:DUF2341 domain-containing protein [Candidatus Lokiarchaeota archaeon]